MTPADKVKINFWRLFTMDDAHKEEADRILENYAMKRVRNMMYQVRVDAVKLYHEKHMVRSLTTCKRRELSEEQYLEARVEWLKENEWPHLARYWASDEYKEKRQKAQESRLHSEDVAQNRGGSRPFAETQQYLEKEFGPRKATTLNTYAVIKLVFKNVDSSGCSGSIPSRKAQKRLDDYFAELQDAYPDDLEQQDLDGNVLYTTGGGLPHGRLPIGDGAVRKADVIAAAKGRNVRPSNSASYRNLSAENERLNRVNDSLNQRNESLTQQQEIDHQLILMLFAKLGEEPPTELLCRRWPVQPHFQGTDSSHAGSQPLDNEPSGGAGTNINDIEVENNGSGVGVNNNVSGVGVDNNGSTGTGADNGSSEDIEASEGTDLV